MSSSSGPRAEELGARRKVPQGRPEQALQQQAVAFIDRAYPAALYFHVPNSSGNRGAVLGGILKSMGVKAGVPDLVFILPHGVAAFIELKASAGRLTPAQQAFRDRAQALGCLWAECRSLPEVEGTLAAWLTPFGWVPRARVAA